MNTYIYKALNRSAPFEHDEKIAYIIYENYYGVYCDVNDKKITGLVTYHINPSHKVEHYVVNGLLHNDNGPASIHYRDNVIIGMAHYLNGKIIGANIKPKTFDKLRIEHYKRHIFL